MEIGDTSEEAANIGETTTKSVEDAENAENTEKFGNTIMVSEIAIFTLAVEDLQFNCDQCNRANSSEKGLTQHMRMKQYPSNDLRHYHFDFYSQVYKERPEGQEKL